MSKKRSELRVTTSFDSKALIVGQVWGQHKEDHEMADFFAYNDIGVPLAFAFAEGIVNHTPTLEKYVNETFDSLLEALNIEDAGFDDYHDLMDALNALERHNYANTINAQQADSTVNSVVSIKNLTLKKRFSEKELSSTETLWKKQDPYDHESWKEIYAAGNPDTSQETLKSLLNSEEDLVKSLVLLNPSFPIQESAGYCRDNFKVACDKRFEILSNLDEDEFYKIFDLDLWDLDEDEIDSARGLLSWIQGDDLAQGSFEYDDEIQGMIFDAGLIFERGDSDQRQILEDLLPSTYAFFKNLSEKNLVSPFLFWTLEVNQNLNRTTMSTEFNTQLLALEDAIHDPGGSNLLQFPEEFKPLADLSSEMIINIEGGSLTVSNRVSFEEDVNLSSIGYEVGSGDGDGYYPTIPFFDSFGNLQVITTFFSHMGDEAQHLEQNLMGYPWDNSSIYGNRIPIKLGYIKSSGSLFFGDSGSIQNGPGKFDTILEFRDLPEEEFLVIKYIDTRIDDGWSYRNQRTWAVSVLRDRAKRNYEILFKVFPELTNRQDDL